MMFGGGLKTSAVFVLFFWGAMWGSAVGQTRKVSVDSLTYDLKNPDAERRKEAALLLGQNEVRSAVPALIEASEDGDPQVRLEVVRALVRINDRRAVPVYARRSADSEKAIQKESVAGIEKAYIVRNAGFVSAVKKAADAVNPWSDDFDPVVVEPYERVDPAATAALAGLLESDDNSLRASSASVLGTLRARDHLPAICARLADEPNENVLLELVRAVYKIGDSAAGTALIPLLRDSSRNVRDESIFALGRLRVKDAVPVLTELYSADIQERKRVLGIPVSGSDELQKNVFQALASIGDARNRDLFLNALTHETDFYRRFGAEGLARLRDAGVITAVGRAYVAESSKAAKLALSFALYRLGREEHLHELVVNSGTRQAAHYLLEFDAAEATGLYPYLRDSKPGVQANLLEVVGLKADESAVPLVQELSRSQDADVASAANLALRRLRGRHS